MLCPKCHAETSDITNTCVWCGATLNWSSSAPSSDPYTATPDRPPPGDPFADHQEATGDYVPPSDASFQANGPAGRPVSEWPPPDAGHRPPHRVRKPWYLTPVPYVAVLLAAIGVVTFLMLRGGRTGAFPELVVGKQPTLLNVYTDT